MVQKKSFRIIASVVAVVFAFGAAAIVLARTGGDASTAAGTGTATKAPGATEEFQRSQQQTNAGADPDSRPEPIRHRGARVGRNDLCPCGSGKKYKNCHMRRGIA